MKIKALLETEYATYKSNNSSDPYSAEVVRYGEAWADLMEQHIGTATEINDVEHAIKECREATSHEADTSGITGFMYGCAASAISHFWEYGEIFRRIHNHEEQLGDEGDRANVEGSGVINPALLNIGTKL